MRKLLLLALLALPAVGFAQETPIYCVQATTTVCTTVSNPGNHYQGDPAWTAFGKLNAWGTQLGLFSNDPANEVLATPSGTTGIPGLRVLVGADIPPINLAGGNQNGGVAGILPIADGGTGITTLTASLCLASNASATAYVFVPCSGSAFQANGVALSSVTTVNFENSAATNGLTLEFLNPSLGNIQLGLTGVLTAAGGGTGLSSITANDCLAGNSGGTAYVFVGCGGAPAGSQFQLQANGGSGLAAISSSGTAGKPLLDGGSGAYPSFGSLNLSLSGAVTGTLQAAQMPAIGGDITCAAGTVSCTVSKVNGASFPASAPFVYSNSSSQPQSGALSGCLAFSAGTIATTNNFNPQTGTTYTVATSDNCKIITLSNASAIALSVPIGSTLGNGFSTVVVNEGAGTVTATIASGTFGGGLSSFTMVTNRACELDSDGTTVHLVACTALNTSNVTSIASGSQALGTSAIGSGACATTIQLAITGATTSDTANITFTTDPNTVTGYKASASGALYVNAFMTSGQLNLEVCNNTAGSITPSAMSVHYSVTSP